MQERIHSKPPYAAAIQVLVNNDTEVKDALNGFAQWSGWTHKKLSTLRADFKKGNKSRDATDLMWQLVKSKMKKSSEPIQPQNP